LISAAAAAASPTICAWSLSTFSSRDASHEGHCDQDNKHLNLSMMYLEVRLGLSIQRRSCACSQYLPCQSSLKVLNIPSTAATLQTIRGTSLSFS
jgi:hypothetical protein